MVSRGSKDSGLQEGPSGRAIWAAKVVVPGLPGEVWGGLRRKPLMREAELGARAAPVWGETHCWAPGALAVTY